MSGMRVVSVFLLLLTIAPPVSAQSETENNPFENDIRAFEETDRHEMPAPGGVLFVGSSSIRMWDGLTSAFPGHHVIQRGFGGSQFTDLLHFADRIVFPYAPRLIVVYEGDNDLESGKSPAQVYGDYREFVGRVRERLPETHVAFIAIKPSIARWGRIDVIREANGLIEAHAATEPLLSFIDIATPMIGEDGRPRPELFIADGLHLSAEGYDLWREAIAPVLDAANGEAQKRED